MKTTFLALTIAAQLAAVAAFAQTSDGTATSTDAATAADTFGSDWSTTLGTALFSEDGTTVRAGTEIMTQWETLSDEDKAQVRRDCMIYMQVPGDTTTGSSTSTEGSTATTDNSAATTTDTTTSATGASPMMNVTAKQMEEICAATKDL